MSTAALKIRIAKRLAKEQDTSILKTIDILLRDETREDAMRRRMNEMAVRSEVAIKKGEVMSLASARKRSKALLKDIAAERGTSRRPAAARKPSARKG